MVVVVDGRRFYFLGARTVGMEGGADMSDSSRYTLPETASDGSAAPRSAFAALRGKLQVEFIVGLPSGVSPLSASTLRSPPNA